ncbi:uncharacterized protein LOC143244401 isoform X1 [Tachypleus tridentatus]|uniref:uncharacterized protein LOC143244401 isoform X1 n=1 Tax=Tachypleus tridentatus TaxID=6853 RepID=UPI003FD64A80
MVTYRHPDDLYARCLPRIIKTARSVTHSTRQRATTNDCLGYNPFPAENAELASKQAGRYKTEKLFCEYPVRLLNKQARRTTSVDFYNIHLQRPQL